MIRKVSLKIKEFINVDTLITFVCGPSVLLYKGWIKSSGNSSIVLK